MRIQSQSTMQNAGQSAGGSQQRTSEKARRRKRKCAGVYLIRMTLGIVAIILVIVVTGVQAEGWEAIADVLFGEITLPEVIRYSAFVLLSMLVGYWMKKPRKIYFKGEKQQITKSEANESKAEE